jgi:hypothetical protein
MTSPRASAKVAASPDPFVGVVGEAHRHQQIKVSQRRLTAFTSCALFATAAVAVLTFSLIDACRTTPLSPRITRHFLGTQLLFATETQPLVFYWPSSLVLAVPALLLLALSLAVLSFRVYRIYTRSLDVGFGLWTKRSCFSLGVRLGRAVAVGIVAAVHLEVVTPLQTVPVFVSVYESACELASAFTSTQVGRLAIQGTYSPLCAGKLAAAVELREWSFKSPLLEASVGNETKRGASITFYSGPVGRQVGCPSSIPFPSLTSVTGLPFPLPDGQLLSRWQSFESKPLRRCIAPVTSPREYALSNWITFNEDCSPATYANFYNATAVDHWLDVHQWFCRQPQDIELDDQQVGVPYASAGSLSFHAGASCEASTDPLWLKQAWQASSSGIGTFTGVRAAVNRTADDGRVVAVQLADVPAADIRALTLGQRSGELADSCTEVQVGCISRSQASAQWMRSVTLSGCRRRLPHPSVAAYAQQLQGHLEAFKVTSSQLLYAGIAEILIDLLEAVIFTAIY